MYEVVPGWPDRVDVMLTTAGTQIFEFRPGNDTIVPITDTYTTIIPAEKRYNRLLGITEYGSYYGDSTAYYSPALYNLINDATNRVIKCLIGKGAENFAQK